MASKHISQHVTHHMTVDMHESLDSKKNEVACAYSDGHRVHGHHAETQPHPELRVSAGDQDGFMWTSQFPFMVTVPTAPPALFFRPLPWISAMGNDGLHRVASGPMDPSAASFMPKLGMKLKFEITRLISTKPPVADPNVEVLDPHFIAEP